MPRRTEHESRLPSVHREPPGERVPVPGVSLGVQRGQLGDLLARLPPVEQAECDAWGGGEVGVDTSA